MDPHPSQAVLLLCLSLQGRAQLGQALVGPIRAVEGLMRMRHRLRNGALGRAPEHRPCAAAVIVAYC